MRQSKVYALLSSGGFSVDVNKLAIQKKDCLFPLSKHRISAAGSLPYEKTAGSILKC